MKNGWSHTELNSLCWEITDGSHFSPKSSEEEQYPYITVRDIQGDTIDFQGCKFIDTEAYSNLVKNGCQPNKGDILFSKDGTVGKVALVDSQRDFVVLSSLAIIRPHLDIIDSNYLKYALMNPAFLSMAIAQKTGVAIRRIILKNLKKIEVSLPNSLTEQKRIVAKLDQAFEAIDQARANVERNLQNAKDLFQSQLDQNFSQQGDGWIEKELIEICDLFVDSAHRTPKYQDEGYPALRPRDVVNGTLNLSSANKVSQDEFEIQTKRHVPKPGDIVYSRELSYGWSAILPESPKVCLSQGMCLFRPSEDVNRNFLVYILNGPIGRSQAKNVAVGAAHPHLNLGDIKSYRIPVSSITKQKSVVEQLDELSEQTKSLENSYRKKMNDLDELKKSILQKAFKGEL